MAFLGLGYLKIDNLSPAERRLLFIPLWSLTQETEIRKQDAGGIEKKPLYPYYSLLIVNYAK